MSEVRTRPVSAIYDPNDPLPDLTCDVFSRLQIVTQPRGGTTIAWGLNPGYQLPCTPHFYVDFGRPGTNEWEPVSDIPVIDGCYTIDPNQRHYDNLADFYYRVRMLLPCNVDAETGQCQVVVSQPHQANGLWSKRDWLKARSIACKEYLLQRKATNITSVGFILKRRRYGVPCTRCLEYDTDEVASECAECFGTQFLGGYYPAVDFRFTLNAPWQRGFKRDPQVGWRNDVVRIGRAVAYPYLDTDDIFVRKDSGERFVVGGISSIAEIGNIPIIVNAELRLVPVTDIIYSIPLSGGVVSSSVALPDPCAPSSSSPSSSPPAPEPCDSRVGLDEEEDW